MFCSNCGKEIAQQASFCSHCGAPVNLSGQQSQQAQANTAPPAQSCQSANTHQGSSCLGKIFAAFGWLVVIFIVLCVVFYMVSKYTPYAAVELAKKVINEKYVEAGSTIRVTDINEVRKIGEYDEAAQQFGYDNISKGGNLYKGLAIFSNGKSEYVCIYSNIGDTKIVSTATDSDLAVRVRICE